MSVSMVSEIDVGNETSESRSCWCNSSYRRASHMQYARSKRCQIRDRWYSIVSRHCCYCCKSFFIRQCGPSEFGWKASTRVGLVRPQECIEGEGVEGAVGTEQIGESLPQYRHGIVKLRSQLSHPMRYGLAEIA